MLTKASNMCKDTYHWWRGEMGSLPCELSAQVCWEKGCETSSWVQISEIKIPFFHSREKTQQTIPTPTPRPWRSQTTSHRARVSLQLGQLLWKQISAGFIKNLW